MLLFAGTRAFSDLKFANKKLIASSVWVNIFGSLTLASKTNVHQKDLTLHDTQKRSIQFMDVRFCTTFCEESFHSLCWVFDLPFSDNQCCSIRPDF